MVVDPHPEEAQLARRVRVAGRELLEVPHERRLRKGLGDVERLLETDARRDLLKQVLERRDSDRLQHRLAIGVGEGEVAHSSATCAR